MTCLNCKHWRMKDERMKVEPLIRYGFGKCAMKEFTHTAPDHVCARFWAAPSAVTEPRVVWFRKLNTPKAAGTPADPAEA